MRGKKLDVLYLDREQLRLLSHPIRQRVLELLGTQEMSTSGLAAVLGQEAPSNLYYHVHRLRSAGLVRLVRTEPRRGTVEKFYRAVAKVFAVKPELVVTMADDQPAQDDVVAAARTVVENTLHQLATSLARGLLAQAIHRVPPLVAGVTIRGPEERLREIGDRLHRWLEDLPTEPGEGPRIEYAGLVMFFPTELDPPRDSAPSPRGRAK